MECRIQATLAMVGAIAGCVLCGLLLFHFQVVRFMHTEILQPNHPAPGKAGIASRLAIGHRWPGLPEPARSV